MNEAQFFEDWKSPREELKQLIEDLGSDPVSLNQVRDGVVKLANILKMVERALEVLGEDYSYTVKMLKEKGGQ